MNRISSGRRKDDPVSLTRHVSRPQVRIAPNTSTVFPCSSGHRSALSSPTCEMSSKSSPEVQEWESLLTAAFLAAPDKFEPLPLSNRPSTIFGSILSFLVCCIFSVGMAFKLTGFAGRSLGCSHLSTMGSFEARQRTRMGRHTCLRSSGTFMPFTAINTSHVLKPPLRSATQ